MPASILLKITWRWWDAVSVTQTGLHFRMIFLLTINLGSVDLGANGVLKLVDPRGQLLLLCNFLIGIPPPPISSISRRSILYFLCLLSFNKVTINNLTCKSISTACCIQLCRYTSIDFCSCKKSKIYPSA